MTALWSESGAVFERTAFGIRKNFKNFNEFIFNLHHSVEGVYNLLEKACLKQNVVDAGDKIFPIENAAVLDQSLASVIEIVKRHLKGYNAGEEACNLWCYLDEAKRGCVHFIKKKGWYAEVYIFSEEDFSALHVIDDEDGKFFIPVIGSHDLSREIKKVSISGGKFLQEYSLRVTDGILGRRSRAWEVKNCHSASIDEPRVKKAPRDRGDNL